MKSVYSVAPIALVLALAAALFIYLTALEASPASPARLAAAPDKPVVSFSDSQLDMLPADTGSQKSTATPPPSSPDARTRSEEAPKQAGRIAVRVEGCVVLDFRT